MKNILTIYLYIESIPLLHGQFHVQVNRHVKARNCHLLVTAGKGVSEVDMRPVALQIKPQKYRRYLYIFVYEAD